MARELLTFRAVIEQWPTRAALARFIGLKPAVVRGWHEDDAIPEPHWMKIVKAAADCAFEGVTYAMLAGLRRGAAKESTGSAPGPAARKE